MVLTIVRLLAGGLMVVSLLNLALYWAKTFRAHATMNTERFAWLSIPLLAGILLMAFSSKIAKRINDHLDIE